jgi:DDE_Tnp_1-associated
MTSSPIPAARSQYLLDLLAQVPDPRKKRGRRHPLAGLLAVGIAAVIAGSGPFAAIGQWAADPSPEVLAALGAARGPAEESTFRRAFSALDPGRLDRVLGAWLWTRAMQVSGRMVIAIDGKTVRGAKDKAGKAPHLVAALAHGIGAVLGQVAVAAKSNEIPAVRDLPRPVRQPVRMDRSPRTVADAVLASIRSRQARALTAGGRQLLPVSQTLPSARHVQLGPPSVILMVALMGQPAKWATPFGEISNPLAARCCLPASIR